MLKISDGNSKLRKTSSKVKAHLAEHGSLNGFVPRPKAYRVVSFNIPAGGYETEGGKSFITCPGAGACLALCYARQGTFLFKGSKRVRIDNHQLLLTTYATQGLDGVVDILDKAVKSMSKTVAVVRLHDSGDFFKKWYVKAWMQVIERHPNILFYAYTKSFPMFKGLDIPDNLGYYSTVASLIARLTGLTAVSSLPLTTVSQPVMWMVTIATCQLSWVSETLGLSTMALRSQARHNSRRWINLAPIFSIPFLDGSIGSR